MDTESAAQTARRPQRGAAFTAALASMLCLLAGPALALETEARAKRELVPTGARATIHLDVPDSAEDTVRELRLEKGKSVFVRTSYSVRRISVGDPKIADVVVLRPQELQIVAKDVGSTNVVLWSTSGEIEAAIDLHVNRPFASIESEIQRVADAADVHVDSAGESIVLTGSVPDAATLERVLSISDAYFPKKGKSKGGGGIVNLLAVGGNQQVMIEVTVSEMSRQLRKAIGTNFAAHIVQNGDRTFEILNMVDGLVTLEDAAFPSLVDAETGLARAFSSGSISSAVNFFGAGFPIGTGVYEVFVNALEETGLGKVLAEPTLVARTGETAKFLAGGEIAIPVSQGDERVTVEFKEFGVAVAFTPTVMHSERIHLDVTAEVSEPDFGLGSPIGGFITPGFRTRRASTGVELGDGQMFAIAGMLRDDLTETVNEYPYLGRIPILGTLFRSSGYRKNLTELVILVRPRLVKPLGESPPPLPTDYLDEPNDFEFYLLGRVEGFNDMVPAEEGAAPQAGLIGDAGYRLPASAEEEGEEAR